MLTWLKQEDLYSFDISESRFNKTDNYLSICDRVWVLIFWRRLKCSSASPSPLSMRTPGSMVLSRISEPDNWMVPATGQRGLPIDWRRSLHAVDYADVIHDKLEHPCEWTCMLCCNNKGVDRFGLVDGAAAWLTAARENLLQCVARVFEAQDFI